MGSSRRKFTKEFKLDAVQRLRAGEPAGLVARSLEVGRQERYRWSRDVDTFGERAFPGEGQKRMEETRIAELERKIGQQVLRWLEERSFQPRPVNGKGARHQ
ncbi:MAG: transposase [Terriglobales bacterium]